MLERAGIDCRPPHETKLVSVDDGSTIRLDETRERWLFARHASKRAAEIALHFDLFRQQAELHHLRHYVLRPAGHKAAPGTLAVELKRFSSDLDRHVSSLVKKKLINPLLTTIHIRFDNSLMLWDIHAHCIWRVDPPNLNDVHSVISVKFSDAWREPNAIDRPGALVNYALIRTIDHRQLQGWPDFAIVELWHLARSRLVRPAGEFAHFRKQLAGKVVTRNGEAITVEEPPVRRAASKRRAPPVQGPSEGRVVAYTTARISGQERLYAVVKSPRVNRDTPPCDPVGPGSASDPMRARLELAYGENRLNSAVEAPTPKTNAQCFESPAFGVSKSKRFRSLMATRAAGLAPRHAWMPKAWPNIGTDIVPRPIRRRLIRMQERRGRS